MMDDTNLKLLPKKSEFGFKSTAKFAIDEAITPLFRKVYMHIDIYEFKDLESYITTRISKNELALEHLKKYLEKSMPS